MVADVGMRIRPVGDDEWEVVAWLWQAFRHDLAPVVNGLPYADGRYNRSQLHAFPSDDTVGYLAWRPHPNTGEEAPIAFALVDGLTADRRTIVGFWVAPAARRGGAGRALAAAVLGRHPGAWQIAFQHDNVTAGRFWRAVADDAFGAHAWTETERPVPGRPAVPPDHFIETAPVNAAGLRQWLLDADPAIRWQVLRDLDGAPAEAVAVERRRVAVTGWGARVLDQQRTDGQWGVGVYDGDDWDSTTDALWILRELGADPRDPRIERAAGLVADRVRWEERNGGRPYFEGRPRPA